MAITYSNCMFLVFMSSITFYIYFVVFLICSPDYKVVHSVYHDQKSTSICFDLLYNVLNKKLNDKFTQ